MENLKHLFHKSYFLEFLTEFKNKLDDSLFVESHSFFESRNLMLKCFRINKHRKDIIKLKLEIAIKLYELKKWDTTSSLFLELLKNKNIKLKSDEIYKAWKSLVESGQICNAEKVSIYLIKYLYRKKLFMKLYDFHEELIKYGLASSESCKYIANSYIYNYQFTELINIFGSPYEYYFKNQRMPDYLKLNDELFDLLNDCPHDDKHALELIIFAYFSHIVEKKEKSSLLIRKKFMNSAFEYFVKFGISKDILVLLFEYSIQFKRLNFASYLYKVFEKDNIRKNDLEKMQKKIQRIDIPEDVTVEIESNMDMATDLLDSLADSEDIKGNMESFLKRHKKQEKLETIKEVGDFRSPEQIYSELVSELDKYSLKSELDEFVQRSRLSIKKQFIEVISSRTVEDKDYFDNRFVSIYMLGFYDICLSMIENVISFEDKSIDIKRIVNLEYLRIRCLFELKRFEECVKSSTRALLSFPLHEQEKLVFLKLLSKSLREIKQFTDASAVDNLVRKMKFSESEA